MTDDRLYRERWRVLREIGKGGQGIAFEVEDIALFTVQAKVLRSRSSQRF